MSKKTIIEWFKLHLSPETLEKAVKNFENRYSDDNYILKEYQLSSFKESLSSSFIYSKTPEGFEYWQNIEFNNGDIKKEKNVEEIIKDLRTKHGQLEDEGASSDEL